ncbi:MAG: peptidylprolyl isomerase [Candidatus Nitrotoga sp.]
MKPNTGILFLLSLGMAWVGLGSMPASAQEAMFAEVNGKLITMREYDAFFSSVLRQRFFHGKVPEGQFEAVRKEVADMFINREVLTDEARHRGFKPEAVKIDRALAEYDRRNGAMPDWKQRREQLLPAIQAQVGQQSLLEQLEASVRAIPQPALTEVRSFYDQNLELFIEPEKLRLSVILLKVDPSATKDAWGKAQKAAQEIYGRIQQGADFAEQARQYSQHESAAKGGDLGYLHRGMMPDALQSKIDKLTLSVPEEPLTVLEGIAIYRLDERTKGALQDFSVVQVRARDLLYRSKSEQHWQSTVARLRAEAKIKILN